MAKKSTIQTQKYVSLILVSFVLLGLAFLAVNSSSNKKSSVNNTVINTSPTPISQPLCPTDIIPPKNYTVQNPLNSFYGWSDGGTACTVFLGPNYKAGYEGFSGEQIQLNVYPSDKVFDTTQLKKGTSIGNTQSYIKDSYGGSDEFIIIKGETQVFEVIWRENPSSKNIENAVKEVIKQL